MKTKESIAKYNKEYFARPEVVKRAKVRNARRKEKRKEYKKTQAGKVANKKYRTRPEIIERVRRRRLELRYGITFDEYNKLLKKQGGVCAICGVYKEGTLHTDHDHKTKKVRGLLCSSCNMAIGLMKDNKEILLKAIKYLNV